MNPQLRVKPGPKVRPSLRRLPLREYDHIIVMFSGGKDSTAAFLTLLVDIGQEPPDENVMDKVELWHQCVDGDPDLDPHFMDWPVTVGYVRAFAKAHNVPLRLQWKNKGFLGEMERNNTPTAPTSFQAGGSAQKQTAGGSGPAGTRRQFPQVSGDLKVRWCSAYLKIDVAAKAITNDPRFDGKKVLIITGERWEESSGRASYPFVEKHRASTMRRQVDQWRPVLNWTEAAVWRMIRDAGVMPHPCYYAGFSRASCAKCIFSGPDEWATIRALDPEGFEAIAAKEVEYGKTIHRSRSVIDQAGRGDLLMVHTGGENTTELIAAARRVLMSSSWASDIFVDPTDWRLPLGAFRGGAGPS